MITNQKIAKLERLLEQTGNEYMPADALQGYLAAVAIGPNVIPPSQWLPPVFFESTKIPDFKGEVNPELLIKSLIEFYNDTLFEIQNYELEPVISTFVEADAEIDDFSGWCQGFWFGLSLWEENWEEQDPDGELISMLLPIIVLADLEDVDDESKLSFLSEFENDRELLKEDLAEVVSDIWTFWAEKRRPAPARSEHIGRNDPCPCGSGKKYKKCCGAN